MRCDPGLDQSFPGPVVLVLRALGLGDLLTAVPALRALKREMPDHRLVLATDPALRPLVAEMDCVDQLLPATGLGPLPIQFDPGDTAVNLHGRGPESTRLLLDSLPEHLIAFAHPDISATTGSASWRRGEHEVSRWCRLLSHHRIPASPADLRLDPPEAELPEGWAGATVVHPGATAPARQWPRQRWGRLIRLLVRQDDRVVVTGGPSEVNRARRVAEAADLPSRAVLAGLTDTATLAAVIARARRLISGDTGPAHLASAFGTPSVVLFGPIPPSEWGPPPDGPHRPIWMGRTGNPLADTPDAGLLAITVDRVIEEVSLLDQMSSSRAAS